MCGASPARTAPKIWDMIARVTPNLAYAGVPKNLCSVRIRGNLRIKPAVAAESLRNSQFSQPAHRSLFTLRADSVIPGLGGGLA
jgi:hypothetical protein